MSHAIRSIMVVLAAVLVALALPGSAAAHEHREVGNYVFVVGFMNEPAFEGELNGIWVSVTTKDTEQPVEGLAETLNAQVIHGASEREMALEPAFGEPGVYTSVFYPTADGDYTFRFFGTIEGNQVDESFTSSPDGFNSVSASAEFQFPAAVPGADTLASQLASAQNTARIALGVGAAGLLAGLAGLMAGLRARGSRSAPGVREGSAPAPH